MAKVLLVYPSSLYHPEWMSRDEIKSPMLALASYINQFADVEYWDLEHIIGRPATDSQIKRFERKLISLLESKEYDIMAISCWTSLSYLASMLVARVARQIHPGRLIVIGGYHPTARPQDFMAETALFDFVILGEGELALKEIIENYQSGKRPEKTGIISHHELPAADFVGMKWPLVDNFINEYFPGGIGTLCVFSSRGCPFNCSFCMEAVKQTRWRAYDVDRAIAQVADTLGRYNLTAIAMGDACFGVNAAWRREFLRKLVALNPQAWVLFETRPEYLGDEDIDLLARLKVQVQFGLESCSPRMLQVMNKTAAPEKYIERFREMSRRLSANEIIHGANLIFNHPGETEESLRETFAFMDEQLSHDNGSLIWACHGYLHFPGSEVDINRAEYEAKYGAVICEPTWWLQEGEPYPLAGKVIPSYDLQGDRVDLWRILFEDRSDALKAGLNDRTFRFAAETYFPAWRNDRRYGQIQPETRK